MRLNGTVNGGGKAPGGTRTDPNPRCCTACIRGTREIQGPCGYALNCPKGCHTKGNSNA